MPLLLIGPLTNLAAAAAESETPAEIDTLLRQLSAAHETRIGFREERSSALLSEPLVLTGALARPQPGTLVREVDSPYRERTVIAGESVEVQREGERPRRFSLRRAPELGGLLASFQALLEGDRRLLDAYYGLQLEGDAQGFVLRLTPSERRLARRVRLVELHGAEGRLNCMSLQQADGGESWMWLGPLATQAAAVPDLAARRALCVARAARD